MTRLPSVRDSKVLGAFKRAGFYIDHIKGSHHYLKHPTRKLPAPFVQIAIHHEDIKKGTLHGILKQAGMSIDEFVELL